jgi:hypothetical protein
VTENTLIRDKFINIPDQMSDSQIMEASQMLSKLLVGKEFGEIISLSDVIKEQFEDYREIFSNVMTAIEDYLKGKDADVVLEGEGKILNHPEYNDAEKVKNFLSVVTSKNKLAGLLANESDNIEINIKIGGENDKEMPDDCSLVTATYSASGRLQTDKWEPLTDERHSNHTNRENHYCVGSFYARSGSKVMVSLDTARVLDDGRATSGTYLFGEPSWNEETISHDNKGMGAENAIRIGIKVTRLNSDLTPSDKPTEFFIYEPNGDAHNDGTAGYVDTPSVDGTSTLIPEERIIKQGASSWSESDPVEKNVIVHRLGDFDGSTDMFIIDIDEIVQIQIYIWLEGQDVDCTNEISEARVVANLQFKSTVIGDSGLVPIPKEEE